jgi:hypothetical protein
MKMTIERGKLSPEERTRLDELEALAKQHEPEPEPEPELPEVVKKELADSRDAIVKANAETATLRQELSARDEVIAREAFIKAESGTLPSLPGTADEKGNVLFTLSKSLKKEDYDKVITLLKAGDAALAIQVAASAEVGTTVALTGATAMDQITELAKQKVQKGEAKSIALAIDLVTREHPDLASAHLKETRGTVAE